ncbi:MAG: hypothetical protein NW216_03940 [Hyphomicrobium sp.]|nr:hypothetical protein [Hyphomicrobium sp.]
MLDAAQEAMDALQRGLDAPNAEQIPYEEPSQQHEPPHDDYDVDASTDQQNVEGDHNTNVQGDGNTVNIYKSPQWDEERVEERTIHRRRNQ